MTQIITVKIPGLQGEPGPVNTLTIGAVTEGTSASASIEGIAPNQVLNLTIPGGVNDHGELTGLGDDDHPHYFNQTRGDARYTQIGHTHDVDDINATGTAGSTTYLRGDGTWSTPAAGGGGVTDHGALTGLSDDDHPQYHNDARGDARYTQIGHTHTAANISDSTATGRSVLTATDASAARTAIGAGTSSLVIGTTGTTAKAGDYQPTAANISDSTSVGRSVLTAANAGAARTAIGAGTSSLALGTTNTTAAAGDHTHTGLTADAVAGTASIRTLGTGAQQAAAGNHTHTATGISDSTATGRSVLTATDATAARTAIGAGTSSLAIGTTSTTAKAGDYQPTAANISDSTATGRAVLTATDAAAGRTALSAAAATHTHGVTDFTATGTKDSTTFLRGDNVWAVPPGGGGGWSAVDATETVKGIAEIATATEVSTGTDDTRIVTPLKLKTVADSKANTSHTHTAANISDSTATGRSVLTATDATAARTAIGAGTSNLAIGTTSTTAKAGDYQPTAANISDSTATGRSVLTATDATAARTAIGAGTSNLAIGTTSTTAKAGDYAPPAGTETAAGILELATAAETTTGTDAARAVHPAGLKVELDKKSNTGHTHTAANISDSTTTGRSVLTATDATAARTAIGAGTSSLVIGTGAGDAKAGNYQPTAANISDSTATGRSVLTATDATAARTAIGAGTSSLAIGTTSTTAKAGDYQPTAANISDSTATGRAVITATDAAAGRTALSAAAASHTHGVADLTATGTRDGTTFLRGDNTWAVPAGGSTPPDASETVKGIVELATAAETTTGTSTTLAVHPSGLKVELDKKLNSNDAKVTADQAAATASIRTIGTGALQAAAGNHTHTSLGISDSTAIGRSILTSADAAAVRATTGAMPVMTPTATKTAAYTVAANELAVMNVSGGGTVLNLPASPTEKMIVGFRALGATTAVPLTINRGGTATIGESGATSITEPLSNVTRMYQYDSFVNNWFPLSDVKPLTALDARFAASSHTHTAANISDSTAVGRSILTAADAAAVRTASGAGRVDSSDGTVLNVVVMTQAAYTALGTKVATTMYVIVG